MARMAGTEPEANHSTDIVANNKEVTVTPSKLRKWRAGAKLEARSTEGNDQWFMAKVQDVDRVNHRVLIHYIHWNSRHDEWVPANSERLRPLRSNRLNGSFNGSLSPNTIFNNSADPNLPKDLKTGDRVMATWKLNRKYPAIVIGYEHESGSYLVEFFDGVQSKVKPTQLRRLRKGEENLSSTTNGEGVESETEPDSVCETVVVPQTSPKGRRERKRKFDVKALLKMRPGFSSSPLSPPLSTTTERTATPSPTPSASSIPEVLPSVNKTKTGGRRNEKITSRTKLTDATKDKVELHIDKPNKKDNQKNPDKIPTPKVKNSDKEIKKGSSDKPRDKSTPVGKSSSLDKATNRSKAILKEKSVAKVSGKTKQINGKTPDKVKLSKQKNLTVHDAKKKGTSKISKSKLDKVPRKRVLLENGEDEVVVNVHSTESENKLVKKEAKVKRTKGDDLTVKGALLNSKPTKPKISKKRKRPDDETSFDEDAPLVPNSNEVVTPSAADSVTSSGKRERKKKKFWDDEDTEQLAVKQKQHSASKSATGPPTLSSAKSRRQTKLNELEATLPSASQDEEDSLVPKANGRPLHYLAFDLSSDPRTIADKMVEGYNIPGPGEPIPIDSSRLPKGWTKLVVQRGIGITKGKWDVFVQNSAGRSFRSKTELQRHLDEIKSLHTSEEFEFSLDERLKRLRQIWKQHIVNSTSEVTGGAAPLKKGHQTASAGEAASLKMQEKNRSNVIVNPKSRKSEPIVVSEPVVLHLPSISVESETGQGLRCSIEKCGKLFRNDRLLQQHVKHYHPEIFDQVIATIHSPTGSSASSPPDASFQVPNDYEHSGPLSPLSQLQSTNSERRRCATLNDLDLAEAEFTPGLKKRKSSLMVDLEAASKTSKNKLRAFEFPQKGSGPGRPLNKRYFSEGSASSPTNNNSVSEKELTNYEIAQSGGRTRTDSILSVAPSEDGEFLLGLKRHHAKNLPPTPPTFRLSKRREAQLVGSDRRLSRRRPFFSLSSRDDDSGLVSPEILTPISGYHLPMAPGSASYPASEMDTSVTSEHLTSEEVVHCSCQRREEDGLMIQCDICLCWQHGICLGVEDEEKVPEKYICETCRHPRGGRASSKFTFDHDWLKEGKLPASRVEAADDDAFKILSDLMADLSNLSKDLHAIRLKLQVASQPNNPKVFMWSNVWDPPNSIQSDNLPKQSQNDKLTVETLTSFDVDESKNGHLDSQAVIEKLKFHLGNGIAEKLIILNQVIQDASCNGTDDSRIPNGGNEQSYTPPSEDSLKEWSLPTGANENFHEEDTGTPSNPISKQNGDANPLEPEVEGTSLDSKSKDESVEETPTSTPLERTIVNGEAAASKDYKHLNGSENSVDSTPKKPSDGPEMTFIQDDIGSHLEDVDQLDGGADQAFDPTLIPTFSEMAQLLPGVLEAIGSEGDTVANTDLTSTFQSITQQPLAKPSAPRDALFEPKRLDRDECRLNLLDHVANLQNEVSARLGVIESVLVNLESGVSEIPTSRSGLVTLLRDVDVTRQLVWSI